MFNAAMGACETAAQVRAAAAAPRARPPHQPPDSLSPPAPAPLRR